MTLSADDTKIKIPDKHYIGFNKRGDDEVPLGFMTPDGTDAAAAKRKATVDTWASRGNTRWNPVTRQHEAVAALPSRSVDNKPMSGFKLGRDVKHGGYGWGQGNVKWRIEDPRGFELEISSPNLAKILLTCTVEQGEILERCVWARKGSDNVLLPETSDVYKAAVANTDRIKRAEAGGVKTKDCQPGDDIVLQNGQGGIYLGKLYRIQQTRRMNEHYEGTDLVCDSKPIHALVQTDVNGQKSLYVFSTFKPAARTPGTPMNPREVEELANKFSEHNVVTVGEQLGHITTMGYGNSRDVLGFSVAPIKLNNASMMGLHEVPYSEVDLEAYYARVFVETPDGKLYGSRLGNYYHHHQSPALHLRTAEVNRAELDNNRKLVTVDTVQTVGQGYYAHRQNVPNILDVPHGDTTVKWFHYEARFTTSEGVDVIARL